MRPLVLLLCLVATAAALDPRGEIVAVRGRVVTLKYEFDDPQQLEDFEPAEPPRLERAAAGAARVEKGLLVLEGAAAVRHRLASQGLLRARIQLRLENGGDGGTVIEGGQAPLLLDLTDRRFYRDGGLMLAWLQGYGKSGVPDVRDVARAAREAIELHLPAEGNADVALLVDRGTAFVRVGSLYREGAAEIAAPRRLTLWGGGGKLSVDAIELTLEMDEPPRPPRPLDKQTEGKLLATIKDAPLSPGAFVAARELSSRDAKAWEKLAALVRDFAAKKPHAALPVVRALAEGPELERRALLAELYKRVKAPEVRFEIARELSDAYPENADLLHEQLKSPLDKRLDLFRALAWRGLPEDVARGCGGDAVLAADAREFLLARDARPDAKHLPELAKSLAQQGFSRRAGLAFLQQFSEKQDWELVDELMKLLQDPELRDGAHLMLLSVSDKDLPPDRDIWRSWVTSKQGAYKPPAVSDPGPVTAAILRGRAALRQEVLEDGVATWPQNPDWPGTRVGATALAVLALRAAGVPKEDAAIQRALKTTLLVWPKEGEPSMRDDLDGYTYALSLLAMALESVDRTGMRVVKEAISRQLCEGQLPNGQWTYHCRRPGYGERPATGDNSNTQFAILGLRSLRRCGVREEEGVIERTRDFWLFAMNAYGGWGYGPKGSFHHEMSMTAAGISTLAICAEALRGPEAVKEVGRHEQVTSGQRRLGELLLNDGFKDQEIYTLYGVERACILTRTRAFNDFDWYHEGADILVRAQKESGMWGDNAARGVTTGQGYGEAVDTSFALLFLKRATTGLVGADESDTVVKVPEPRRPSKPK